MINRHVLVVLLLALALCVTQVGATGTTEGATGTAAATGGEVELTAGGYTWPSAWLEPKTASQMGIKRFKEAPALAAAVKAGKLPAVEKRLPDDPMVIAPYRSVGKYGGTIRVARTSPGDWGDLHRGHQAFLFRSDPSTGEVAPFLAESYEIASDNSSITIRLRKGTKWSDGEPFTTDDFMWNYQYRLTDPDVPVGLNNYTFNGQLMKFQKIDDYTIKWDFGGPVSLVNIKKLLNWNRSKQGNLYTPAHYMKQFHIKTNPNADKLAKEAGYENWMGYLNAQNNMDPGQPFSKPEINPWYMEDVNAQRKRLVRNPYFFAIDSEGNQLPYIDAIEAVYYSDKQVAILDMMQGKIDIGGRMMNPDEFPLYKENEVTGGYKVYEWQDTKTSRVNYHFNLTHPDAVKGPIYSDKRFRQAMSLAINRVEINEFAFLGLGRPGQFTIDPGVSFYNPAWGEAYAAYDPSKAKALLDQMGLKDKNGDGLREAPGGQPFEVDLLVSTESVLGTMGFTVSELIAQYWREVGVKVNLRQIAQELFETRSLAGEMDITVFPSEGDLATRVDPDVRLDNESIWGYAMPWHLWIVHRRWENGGKIGDEPAPGVRPPQGWVDLIENYDKWAASLTEADYEKYGKLVWSFGAEQLGSIGTVGKVVRPIIINNRLQNVPEKLPFSFESLLWVMATPAQWWVTE